MVAHSIIRKGGGSIFSIAPTLIQGSILTTCTRVQSNLGLEVALKHWCALDHLAEGVSFVQKAGLNPDSVFSTLSKGAGQSWQMENRYRSTADNRFDFGFAVEWMHKDLGICLAEAQRLGANLPITKAIDDRYALIEVAGGKCWDTSSLVTLLR
ncbi:NAD-binding protein [Devosia sp.]|uniref:NAD-binding protein n=1 Tax=Devosia sp. TaxID=1871048 RepID=UPI002637112A|nr:NAD-binding protein [Devosia sp.]